MKSVFLVILFNYFLLASDIGLLLDKIKVENDLSKKTKKENGGLLDIFTRDDIERMQIHNINDILKFIAFSKYRANSFGSYDPFYTNQYIFSSSAIRVFIDDQEIANGFQGSGITIYEDIDINFVDHIEVYSLNPTFEYSTEPSVVIIKLYSKKANRDSGSKIDAFLDSRDGRGVSFYNSDILNNGYSYFAYVSNIKNKYKKYYPKGKKLSKDKILSHILATYSNNKNNLLIDYITPKKDTFIGRSVLLTPDENNMLGSYLHIGFKRKQNDNLVYQISYDRSRMKYNFYDKETKKYNPFLPYSTHADILNNDFNIDIKYKQIRDNNQLLFGAKIRDKRYKYKRKEINEQLFYRKNKEQLVSTIFAENMYNISNSSIFTAGAMFSKSDYKDSIQKDNLFGIRLGFTKTTQHFTFKTIASVIERGVEPYEIDDELLKDNTKDMKVAKRRYLIQAIKYEKNNNLFDIRLIYFDTKNEIVADKTNKIYNYGKDMVGKSANFIYQKKYNYLDKLYISYLYGEIENLPYINDISSNNLLIRNINKINKFDIFNELLYYKDNQSDKKYYNYTLGSRYHYNDDLVFAIKADNIFNKATTGNYTYIDTSNPAKPQIFKEQYFSRKITFNVEWTF